MTTIENTALDFIISLNLSKKVSIALLYCFYLDSLGIISISNHTNNLFQFINTHFDDIYPSSGISNTLEDFMELNIEKNDENVFNESVPLNFGDYKSIDWKLVNTELFGVVYENITDRDTKKSGGIFYTSKDNILRLIKPLFLDELWYEFFKLKDNIDKLREFHNKISNLKFLDPACGCGNFLITTYKELVKLESKIIDVTDDKKLVSIEQLHGIEIEPIAAQTCVLALSITEKIANYQH